jgi:hypothetical protein
MHRQPFCCRKMPAAAIAHAQGVMGRMLPIADILKLRKQIRELAVMRNTIISIALSFFAVSIQAAPVTWTIDSPIVAGTFDYDADLNIYSNENISSAVAYDLMHLSFSDANDLTLQGIYLLDLINSTLFNTSLTFDEPLTNVGGTISFAGYWWLPDVCCVEGTYIGTVSATSVVPVPGAIWLFISALAVTSFRKRNFIAP